MVASYEVTAPAARRAVALVRRMAPAAFLLVVAGAVFVADRTDPVVRSIAVGGTVVTSILVAVGLAVSTRAERLLVVEPPGIRIGSAAVPWTSVRHIVVAPVAGTDEVEVGLRLWPAAPLPDGVRAVLFDPTRPQMLQIRRRFPARRVDPHRLLATARALAPPTVAMLTEKAPHPDVWARDPRAVGRRQTVGTVTAVRQRSGHRVFLRTPSMRGADYRHRFTRHPVVRFHLPGGLTVLAETSAAGSGEPGDRMLVTYDADPTDVRIVGPKPPARWLRTA
jgi:hypothetical protein